MTLNVSEKKLVLIVIVINTIAFIVFVGNGILNFIFPSAIVFSNVIVISLTNLANDLYQYKNSNIKRLDSYRGWGLALTLLLFIVSILLLAIFPRIGFDNNFMVKISEGIFVLIGVALVINHILRLRVVIKDKVLPKKEYLMSTFTNDDWQY